jgi:hypothetical protein
MSQTKIDRLTEEQIAMIPIIRQKWKSLALLTEPLDRPEFINTIKAAYLALNLTAPKIHFFESPMAGINFLKTQPESELGMAILHKFNDQIIDQINDQIDWENGQEIKKQIDGLPSLKRCQLARQLTQNYQRQKEADPVYNCIKDGVCLCIASQLDFCISVLNLEYEPGYWEAYNLLMSQGGYVFAFDKMCVVCDRPTKLSIDNEERLHAEGESAIEFADGFYRKYVYHGVELPEEYGQLHPHQWQAKWLLKEKNAEIKRLLIQEIGYARICQELEATELDSWHEYTLLQIADNVDVEPIYLLKMTCPSTNFIHALRVPPDVKSARGAIRWVNWGIDPEKFVIET